jgi:hypothetical protein
MRHAVFRPHPASHARPDMGKPRCGRGRQGEKRIKEGEAGELVGQFTVEISGKQRGRRWGVGSRGLGTSSAGDKGTRKENDVY